MAKDIMQQMRDKKVNIKQLLPGQFGFATDTEELFIGNGDGNKNIPINGSASITDGSIDTAKIENGAVTEEKLSSDVQEKLNATGSGGGGPIDPSEGFARASNGYSNIDEITEALEGCKSGSDSVVLDDAIIKEAVMVYMHLNDTNGETYINDIEHILSMDSCSNNTANVSLEDYNLSADSYYLIPACTADYTTISFTGRNPQSDFSYQVVNPNYPIQAGEIAVVQYKESDPYAAYPHFSMIWHGTSGSSGAGIQSIQQITNNTGSGAANTVRITLTDGSHYDVTVYNGEQGTAGVGGSGSNDSDISALGRVLLLSSVMQDEFESNFPSVMIRNVDARAYEYNGLDSFNSLAVNDIITIFNNSSGAISEIYINDEVKYTLSQSIPRYWTGLCYVKTRAVTGADHNDGVLYVMGTVSGNGFEMSIFDGVRIKDGTISEDKLDDNTKAKLNAFGGGGVGIQSISQTNNSGSGVANTITIKLTDGSTKTLTVYNGAKGETGAAGTTGAKGDKGDKGDTGATGPKGDKGDKGDKGETGATGPQGLQGPSGVTNGIGTNNLMPIFSATLPHIALTENNITNIQDATTHSNVKTGGVYYVEKWSGMALDQIYSSSLICYITPTTGMDAGYDYIMKLNDSIEDAGSGDYCDATVLMRG